MTNPALRTSRLVAGYRRYLSTANSLRFADELSQCYLPSTLAKLLTCGGVEVRRAAALALGIFGDATTAECLGRALADSDRGVRLAADDAFRATLVRDAAPLHHQQLLQIMHLNDGGEFAAALSPAMILVHQAPNYVEAQHQLGVCWEGLRDDEKARQAFGRCLWLCRFHYPAWQGFGRCCLEAGDLPGALRALERAVDICPDLESPRAQARAIRRRLGLSPRRP